MTPPLDTRQVRHAFGRAAATYAAHAVLQHEVEQRLLERLEYLAGEPERVLDVGCGPGGAALAMRKRWKSRSIWRCRCCVGSVPAGCALWRA
jgi:malonyl-CoA O-methyltransferase